MKKVHPGARAKLRPSRKLFFIFSQFLQKSAPVRAPGYPPDIDPVWMKASFFRVFMLTQKAQNEVLTSMRIVHPFQVVRAAGENLTVGARPSSRKIFAFSNFWQNSAQKTSNNKMLDVCTIWMSDKLHTFQRVCVGWWSVYVEWLKS